MPVTKPPHSIIVVGGGLAGACAAAVLGRERAVLLVDAAEPGAGASGAAAGLVNPFPGRRAAPAWRHREALEALEWVLDVVGLTYAHFQKGLLRPAGDGLQATTFGERAAAHPGELVWLSPDAVAERWPQVRAPHGALWVAEGAAIDMAWLVNRLLREIPLRKQSTVLAAGEGAASAWIETAAGERLEAEYVFLALGEGFRTIPQLKDLPLSRVKGQTIRLARPPELDDIPPIAGSGYVVPEESALLAGSSFEHHFASAAPSAEVTEDVLSRVSRMVPALAGAQVLEARAGVRVTVPARISRRRLPMVGPLPGHQRLWTTIGLGAKGLLTAPLIASRLPDWLARPESIPGELRVGIAGGRAT